MAAPRAVIESGVVANIVMADQMDPGSVAIPDGVAVGIGWLFDGQSFTPGAPLPAYNTYSVAQFIEAMSRSEALAMLAAIKTDPLLEMWYELAKARNLVDFNDADTRSAAPYLVSAGVLTQARLDELVGG